MRTNKGLRIVALPIFAVSGAGCATLIPRDVVLERLADGAEQMVAISRIEFTFPG
jgi:hypothetical protein